MHKLRRRTFLLALIILGFAIFGLWRSCWGQSCWGPNSHGLYEADLVGISFHSLFYLVPAPDSLNITLKYKHWALYIALLLSPLFTLSVLLEILRTFASDNFARLRLKFWSGHVVIFGGGERARALVEACSAQNSKAVVFSNVFSPETTAAIQAAGFPLIQAELANYEMLAKARLPYAKRIIAAHDKDLENIDITPLIKSFLEQEATTTAPASIHCLTLNEDFQSLLIPNSRTFTPKDQMRIDIVKTGELAARRFASQISLYEKAIEDGLDCLTLVFFGFGKHSAEILKHLLMASVHPDLKLANVIIFSPFGEAEKLRLKSIWPEMDLCAKFTFMAIQSESTVAAILKNQTAFPSLFVVEQASDHASLLSAVKLRSALKAQTQESVPILYVSNSAQVTPNDQVLKISTPFEGLSPYNPFDAALIFSSIDGQPDARAVQIHEAYLSENKQRQDQTQGDGHAYVKWAYLGENYRANNRRAADHIPAKQHAVGAVKSDEGLRLDVPENLERLAAMEHEAWNMNRRLSGWCQGERNDAMKTHPDLIPYEQLSEKIKGYDRQQVIFIDRMLKSE